MNPCPKRKPWRSEPYKAFIRTKPCLKCLTQSEPHHEGLGRKGTSTKPPDSHCVPLCRECHDEYHHVGPRIFWEGYDVRQIIIDLMTEYLVTRGWH